MPALQPAVEQKTFKSPFLSKVSSPLAIRLGLLVVLSVAFLSYAVTTGFEFAYDDWSQIVQNPRIHSAQFLPQYFTHHVWAQAQGQPENLYRPLYLAWLLINYAVFGDSPAGWHWMNVLLHLLVSFLVYIVGRRLIPGSPAAALLATAVFALHPSHVEAVAWISGGTEPLLSLFFLGSFLCYVEYRQRDRKILWLVASLVLCAAAMLVKETAVVLPVLIAGYELLLAPTTAATKKPAMTQLRFLSLVATLSPYVVLIALYFVVRVNVLHGFAHRISDAPLSSTVLTWPWAVYFYFSQLLAPVGLGPFYDVDYATGFNWQLLLLPLLVLGAIGFMLWWWARKSKTWLPIFFAAWFLLTLAPMLAVFTIMSRYENVHDRYLYLPSVGFALLAGYGAASLLEHPRFLSRQKVLASAIAVILAALGAATYYQSLYWRDNLTLFTRGADVAPHNVLAKLNLTSELIRYQRYDGAFQVAQQAAELAPKSPLALSAAGQAAYLVENYVVAEHDYSRALELAPARVDQLYYLGMTRIKTGRYSEALTVLQKGNALWPNSPGYHMAMGNAFAGLGHWTEARQEYQLEINFHPDNLAAKAALAEAANKP